MHGVKPQMFARTTLGIFVDDSVVVDGKISYTLLAPVARMGYRDYANINDFFELGRPIIKIENP